MGVLIDFDCRDLILPASGFDAARRRLARLAKTDAESFAKPDDVIAARDLEEALANASFRFDKNDAGAIVALRYGADKAPSSSGAWPDAILAALAPSVAQGHVVVGYEGEPHETVYRFARGKLAIATRKKKKGKKAAASKRAKSAAAVVHPGEPASFEPLPETSFGILWSFCLELTPGCLKDRERIGRIVERLAATTWFGEVTHLAAMDKAPAVIAPTARTTLTGKNGGRLDVGDVKRAVATGIRDNWCFHRSDGEVAIELGLHERDIELRFRARDTGLTRLGDAANTEPEAVASDLVDAFADDEGWLRGYATAFAARPLAEAGTDVPLRWPASAYALVLDARCGDEEDVHDEVRALHAKRVAKGCVTTKLPAGAKIVRWPWKDRANLTAALGACAQWMGDAVERFAWRAPKRPYVPLAPRTVAATGDLANYELWWRIEAEIFDRTMWYRDPGRVRLLVELLARTAWWSEVGAPNIDDVWAQAMTSARGTTVLRGNDAHITLERRGLDELSLRLVGKVGALERLGARAISDVVAFLAALHEALRGRVAFTYAAARPYGGPWAQAYSEEHEADSDYDWPEGACTTLVLDPTCHDAEDREKLARVRALASAPPPQGTTREAHGRLIVLSFLDELADPLAAARASEAHAHWQRWIRGR